MTKEEFKKFCDDEFTKNGFKKYKGKYYSLGLDGILCSIEFQKSNYGKDYYLNYYFSIGDYRNIPQSKYPSHYDHDIYGRFTVLSKMQTDKGVPVTTALIEYEYYTPETLRRFFDLTFKFYILPPISQGKKYILNNLGLLYKIDLRKDEVMKKLRSED